VRGMIKTVHNETVWLVKKYGLNYLDASTSRVFISVVFALNGGFPAVPVA